jgi:hypothetical protein
MGIATSFEVCRRLYTSYTLSQSRWLKSLVLYFSPFCCTVCKSCTVSFHFWLYISHEFCPRRFFVADTRIFLLLHLTCTNTPSFYLPTLHQWRRRPSGSNLSAFHCIFSIHFVDKVVFLCVIACPWIRYIICVTALLSTEKRIEIHANSRRWRIANYQCSTCQKGFNCTRFLGTPCLLIWESNQKLPKIRSRFSDRSSTTFGTSVLIFLLLYHVPFHIDTPWPLANVSVLPPPSNICHSICWWGCYVRHPTVVWCLA